MGTFRVVARATGGPARAAVLHTAHGPVHTPCFMPVGTYGAVKGLDPDELADVGSQVILGNAYHLAHRPGADRIAAAGGLHGFGGWPGPILTDSGGYQVFSLRGLQRIDDHGVTYRTHFDGSRHRMTPRSVLEVQAKLGSDICMVLDHCPPGDATIHAVAEAMERTTRWAREAATLRRGILADGQLLFGIVQGGTDLALRRSHLAEIAALPFDGLALGGLSVGEPVPEMHATLRAIAPEMPEDRPRYVMGIGTPIDLLVAMASGVDMFDCVIPTRHARNGQLLTFGGRINVRNGRFRDAHVPPDPDCACSTCRRFTLAFLRHLHEQGDPLYGRLATIHNLHFFHELVAMVRRGLVEGRGDAVLDELFRVISRHYGPAGGSGAA
ncbi:MAG: tRNA guanosine(34) transglycosylase Tgt [Deltaproteobacteria bacterium]|nr:MAG: tRNA guanosine(34) transglycosylase Tgt [Deltaproteobacteria bacterium]